MLEIAERLSAALERGESVTVTTVSRVHGSAPRTVGTSMALAVGHVLGSISGGCVEGAAVEACERVAQSGRVETARFGFSDETAFAVGLSCGGELDVVVHAVEAEYLRAELAAAAAGRAAAVAVVVTGPAALLGRGFGGFEGSGRDGELTTEQLGAAGLTDLTIERVRAETAARLRSGGASTVSIDCGDSLLELLCESSLPAARMLLFGAVEFAAALSDAAVLLGYRVTICDPRPAFATPQRFPSAAEVVVEWPQLFLEATEVDDRTVICVLSHDDRFDSVLLQAALRLPVAYVGALGSRRTHERRVQRMRAAGTTAEELGRLHSPIGLDLGASSPEETAVSILAEILAERTGADGRPLRERSGPIHRRAAMAVR